MRLAEPDAAFLATCLRAMAAEAPCRDRVLAVADAVVSPPAPAAGSSLQVLGGTRADPVPQGDSLFVRSLSLASVLWSIDTGRVDADDQDRAQRVMDEVWRQGAIRPELIAAQLRCLVGQESDDPVCVWSCASMPHANAGYEAQLAAATQTISGLLGTVAAEAADTLAVARLDASSPRNPRSWTPRHGTRTWCTACGREGTVLGVDPEDGWTVIDHHPTVRERDDGFWEVVPVSGDQPRQCRFLDRGQGPRRG